MTLKCMGSRFAVILALLFMGCGSQTTNELDACPGIEPRAPDEIAVCNQLGERIIVNLAMPEGSPPPGGWPAVIVLHGSGGLYLKNGEGDELGPCSMVLEDAFRIWRDLLTDRGYVVAMPNSFYSRGHCEWNADDKDRMILRVFDTRATEDWLCRQPTVDCDRMALLGFSNGGSVALMALQSDMSITKDSRLREHGPNRPVRGAVAYYPGCGLENQLTESLDPDDIYRFYSPLAPVLVQHAERDDLLDDCEDFRDPQVEQIDEAAGRSEDWFDLRVYNDARHGFDAADEDKKKDYKAKHEARGVTLETLDAWLKD
jgi:dienelactone hydrolase